MTDQKHPQRPNDLPKSTKPQASLSSRSWQGTEGTVRDRLWVFCCPPNTDFGSLQQRSVMTAAECACYLDVPNVIMVQASAGEAQYGRFEPPFAQYARGLRPFKRVAWSIVGSGGFTSDRETAEVLQLAAQTPNITGIMLDDFFRTDSEGNRAVLTVAELRAVRQRIAEGDKALDLLVTYYYARSLDLPLNDYLELIDVVTLWGGAADIPRLEDTIAAVEERIPGKRVMLGCYLFDFARKEPLPIELMQTQCETGLRWLKQGRIEGMIILGNTVADLGFPSVEWTRSWIERVGDETV